MTPIRYPPTPPMPAVRGALMAVADAQAAIDRAAKAWNARQLRDALRSAKDFIAQAEAAIERDTAK